MIKNINIVIISSLPDKSMKSIGNKALIDFHGVSLIEHQINNIRTIYKKAKIIIVGGFEHKKLHDKIKAKKNISYVYQLKCVDMEVSCILITTKGWFVIL